MTGVASSPVDSLLHRKAQIEAQMQRDREARAPENHTLRKEYKAVLKKIRLLSRRDNSD